MHASSHVLTILFCCSDFSLPLSHTLFKKISLQIHETYMGNVLSAGQGQAPCRQAVIGAGLPPSTICTTINKVCASGMKSVMLSAQAIQAGNTHHVYLAGGFESMTNAPHYLRNNRTGIKLGNMALLDGAVHDGLWDVYNNQHMVRRFVNVWRRK